MFCSHALRIWLPHRCPNSDLPTSDSPAARSIRPLCHGQRCGLLGGNAVAEVAGEQADAVHLPGQWSQLPGDRWAPSLDSITNEPTFSFRNVFVCKKKNVKQWNQNRIYSYPPVIKTAMVDIFFRSFYIMYFLPIMRVKLLCVFCICQRDAYKSTGFLNS